MESAESYELDINPKKVCRLCLSQPSTLVNIYSTSIVDGYIISVPDMLAFTVDITVITLFFKKKAIFQIKVCRSSDIHDRKFHISGQQR